TEADHPNVARVRAYAAERGHPIEVRRFAASTRTAEDAAREIGTEVARIVKSLVFVASGAPVIVLASGPTRVDERALAATLEAGAGPRGAAGGGEGFTRYAPRGGPPFPRARARRVVPHGARPRPRPAWAGA